ncbi:MAG: hypothetical protein IPK60_20745 [Sandaracinaceae bacterium]|nr:hypothetical protein [Sandaracinaceae bacterium]
MNQPSLLQRYAARGIHFEPIGAQVRFVAIGQVFDAAAIDELRSQISRVRLELLEKLRGSRLGDLGAEPEVVARRIA